MTVLDRPLVLAPMAGGPSTVELAAAVTNAGGFAFLAGAYLAPDRLRDDIVLLRAAVGGAPFGVNLFAPSLYEPGSAALVLEYATRLQPLADKAGVPLAEPVHDDDSFDAKIEVILAEPPAVVSFAFAWPPADVVDRLRAAGIEVWVTLNDASETAWADELGVDGVIAQGWEAGGHRGGPVDTGHHQAPTRLLLQNIRQLTDLPVVAAGGVADSAHVVALLGAGAHAVACGTAFLGTPEAGTADIHRHELTHRVDTVVTRAFTGRSARALVTSWTEVFSEVAPAAYPQVHHLTLPLRAHGKATGQPDLVHLWAGTGHRSVRSAPAAEIVADLLSRT
ncbi:2-nitropropane dioxygenase [Knoellia sinensis KCTC 19936]|uniref:Propionate 3-nitronate monooxygenase n=1 Tax=Knoellia sinensis KCTC 19936 TaxID=1385520 RepID=A0A0A0JBX5_9MICO|nr:nitronate monooxygenase [Knoellia sinensis]KGN34673.1 2-nitropropane dioxygenase [Knoellia sinensis KCTC 19936]